jgi:hypothetical protein
MNPYRLKVTLRITHPFLTLLDITRALSLKPSGGWTAGDQRVTPAGHPLEGARKETYWYRSLPLSRNAQLSSSIKALLNRLPSRKNFFKKVRAKGGTVEFFVGWFIKRNSGETLGQDVLKDLSNLQIDLALDVYPPSHNTRKRSR